MWSEVAVWYRRTETRPASLQGQLNDGRTWRKHVDDVLQNRPSPVATESGTIMAQVQAEAATEDSSPSNVE